MIAVLEVPCPGERREIRVAVLFDTRSQDPPERGEGWSAAHEQIFFPIDVRFAAHRAEEGRLEGHNLGPLNTYRVVSEASVVRRSHHAIRMRDPEQFVVGMPFRGRCLVEQAGRASSFGARDLSSWDSSHPFSVTTRKPFDLLLLVVPRTLLGPRREAICRRVAGQVSAGSAVGAVAAPFFRKVWETLDDRDTETSREDIADAVIAMVRALHAEPASRAGATTMLPGPVLLAEMKAYIDRHLGDPRLSPASIAGAHYVSTRYVHKLFAGTAITVSDWVRYRRLEACRRDIRDPALADQTISELARRWALSDPAHFSRIFRAEYGCTPSEDRAAVRAGGAAQAAAIGALPVNPRAPWC
jgi:AraC-like DNA-binding protein